MGSSTPIVTVAPGARAAPAAGLAAALAAGLALAEAAAPEAAGLALAEAAGLALAAALAAADAGFGAALDAGAADGAAPPPHAASSITAALLELRKVRNFDRTGFLLNEDWPHAM